MTRLTVDEAAMATAKVWAARSTCLRRSVGCVLTDAKGRVLATGYNGVATGMDHCNRPIKMELYNLDLRVQVSETYYPNACPGARAQSGADLDGCHAIHAEQNALLQCRDPDAIHTCYCTTAPCVTCVKLLLNTGCQRIVFSASYPHAEASKALWEHAGRTWAAVCS